MPVWDAASATLYRRIQRLGKQFEDARIWCAVAAHAIRLRGLTDGSEYVYTTARLRFMANRYLVSTAEIAQAQRDGRRVRAPLARCSVRG